MGKTSKIFRGHSCCFVSDSWHAVGAISGSEGYGSSRRFDIAPEDSGAPKSKRICLNVDGHCSFEAPIEVFSLSKISGSEGKDLQRRLKMDLERIWILQKKLASLRPVMTYEEKLKLWMKLKDLPGELPDSIVDFLQEQSTKDGPTSGDEIVFDIENLKDDALFTLQKLLDDYLLEKRKNQVKDEPCGMESTRLATNDKGKEKLVEELPKSTADFMKDSSMKGGQIIEYYVGTDIDAPNNDHSLPGEQNTEEKVQSCGMDVSRRMMSEKERHKLGTKLVDCCKELPNSIIDFLTVQCMKDGQNREDEIVIDVETLNDDALFTLQKLLDEFFPEKQAKDEEKDKLCLEFEDLLDEVPDSIINFLKEQCMKDGQTIENCVDIDMNALSDDAFFTFRKLLDEYLLEKHKNQATVQT